MLENRMFTCILKATHISHMFSKKTKTMIFPIMNTKSFSHMNKYDVQSSVTDSVTSNRAIRRHYIVYVQFNDTLYCNITKNAQHHCFGKHCCSLSFCSQRVCMHTYNQIFLGYSSVLFLENKTAERNRCLPEEFHTILFWFLNSVSMAVWEYSVCSCIMVFMSGIQTLTRTWAITQDTALTLARSLRQRCQQRGWFSKSRPVAHHSTLSISY